MGKKFFSLQYEILIFSFIVIIIPILTIGIFSYMQSSNIVQQKVSISNLNTVRQIGERIDFIFQDAHDMSLFLIQNEDVRGFFKLENAEENAEISAKKINLERSLRYLISSKPYIYSIYFKGFNGITMDTKNASNPINEETEKQIIGLKGGYLWNFGKITNYDGTSTNTFSMTRVVKDMNKITNSLAIMRINISENDISNIYSNEFTEKRNNNLYIIDSKNKIISSVDKKSLGQELNLDISNIKRNGSKAGYFQTSYSGQDYLITYYIIENMNYTIINLVPLKELLKGNQVIQVVTLEVLGVSFLVCILAALLFSIKVLSPLKKIRLQMKKIENEDFDVQITVTGNNEIAMLGRSFNKMSAKLKELINQVYLTRIKQKEAQLSAIQSQINPHFLYNALDTIYWMGRMEKAFETSKLIEALAKMFRLSLNSGKEFTLLSDEVEHIRNYILIQEKRFGNSIGFDIEIQEGLLECQVFKLVLQPLVENAIIHGIDKKAGKGNIKVSIKKIDENLVYKITDDGIGVDISEINFLLKNVGNSNRGLGIKNINDRLKLYFGEQYGITFISEKGKGTTVFVKQPFVKGGNSSDQSSDC